MNQGFAKCSQEIKDSVQHCQPVNYLKRNLGCAQIDDEDAAEILELNQLTSEQYARGLRPRNITPTAGGSNTTITE